LHLVDYQGQSSKFMAWANQYDQGRLLNPRLFHHMIVALVDPDYIHSTLLCTVRNNRGELYCDVLYLWLQSDEVGFSLLYMWKWCNCIARR
jgi:hypothetical protein